MLLQLIKHLIAPNRSAALPVLEEFEAADPQQKSVLNVGGNSDAIELPDQYMGWRKVLLDIDPTCDPDVLCDSREMAERLPSGSYDSVYCSHNLEHYYRHDVDRVLKGFQHVLKDDGFAYIVVPDVMAAIALALEKGHDIDDVMYESPMGPITYRDLVYGHADQIAKSGVDFFAHKTGFSEQSVRQALKHSGFSNVYSATGHYEIVAIAFKQPPSAEQRALLGLPTAEAEAQNALNPSAQES